MRQADFTPGRLPSEWLKAISEAKGLHKPEALHLEPDGRSGDEPLDHYEHQSELRSLVGRLKRERIRRGLSLGDIAKLTQQARSAISRLESGEYTNPTLHTVYRYARALGWHIKLYAEPFTDASQPQDPNQRLRRK